jgi:DNA modification methylase
MSPPAGRHWRTDVAVLEQWDKEGLIEWSSTGNPRKIIYAEDREGMRVQDVWEFKDPQYALYPTEKNADMLDLIVRTSSNPGSLVLDCFCGSGTTLVAAQQNNRRWIGIDQSDLAIAAAKNKIEALTGTSVEVVKPAAILHHSYYSYPLPVETESEQLVLFEKGKRYKARVSSENCGKSKRKTAAVSSSSKTKKGLR